MGYSPISTLHSAKINSPYAALSLFLLTALTAHAFDAVLLGERQIEALRERVAQRLEPTYSAYRLLEQETSQDLQRLPQVPPRWHVPAYYADAEGHRQAKHGLSQDANAAYRLALHYRLSDRTDSAESAVRLIDAWTSQLGSLSREADSTLTFCYHFPAMIFAADLLKGTPKWSNTQQTAFTQFLKEKALPMHTMGRTNNWGNWGLVLVLASAAFLNDHDLFAQGVGRWKDLLEHQIAEDGHLLHEVNRNGGRSGLWYSNFCLFPQTIAAEIARANGVELYDYVAPNGRTLRQAFDRLAPWTNQPETFPYFQGDPHQLHGADYISYYEILNAYWPNPHATAMLRRLRPLTASHSLPHLTLTHGQPAASPEN